MGVHVVEHGWNKQQTTADTRRGRCFAGQRVNLGGPAAASMRDTPNVRGALDAGGPIRGRATLCAWVACVLVVAGLWLLRSLPSHAAASPAAAPQPTVAQHPQPTLAQQEQPATTQQHPSELYVSSLQFHGNTVFTNDELQTLVADAPGRSLTFSELDELADRVTHHYRAHGYVGSQAYIPPQDVVDGELQIAVVEGRYGAVVLQNESRLRDRVAQRYFKTLSEQPVIHSPDLQNRMAALTALPGVRGTSALSPGSAQGTADFIVSLRDGPRFSGSLSVDNTGTRYAGQPRAGLTLVANNVTGNGDRVVVRTTSSGGPEFFHGHIGYDVALPPFTRRQVWAPRLGLSYNVVDYRLGDAFQVLDVGGSATTTALSIDIPLRVNFDPLRGGGDRLDLNVEYSQKQFEDWRGSGAPLTRDIDFARLGLTGHRQGRTASDWHVTATFGQLRLHSALERLIDGLTANTNGSFVKVTFGYSFARSLSDSVELHGSLQGQWASKNLDTSEKLSLGGASGQRAYPSGDSSGDDALLLSVELRRLLLARPLGSRPASAQLASGGQESGRQDRGRLHGTVFADYGHALLYKNPWGTGTGSANERTLTGVGIGLEWKQDRFTVSMQHAWRLGTQAATADQDADARLWMSASYRF